MELLAFYGILIGIASCHVATKMGYLDLEVNHNLDSTIRKLSKVFSGLVLIIFALGGALLIFTSSVYLLNVFVSNFVSNFAIPVQVIKNKQ